MISRSLAILLLLAACAPTPAGTNAYRYQCDDGSSFRADFGVEEEVTIRVAGSQFAYVLPQAMSASGIRYAFKDYSFWGKGNEARWQAGKDAAETRCDVIGN